MATNTARVHGKRACDCQVKILPLLESKLRAAGAVKQDLSGLITQGAYSTGVAASAGTHAGGGVLDVKWSTVDTAAKLKAWRECGYTMSPRLESEGPWPRHGHGVLIGCPHLSPTAARQVVAYRQGRNGLSNQGRDRGPRVRFVTWQQAIAEAEAAKSKGTISLAAIRNPGKNPANVKRLQQALRAAGRDPGPVDGDFGPRTRAAYAAFERSIGLTGDGKPGKESLGKLAARSGYTAVS